MPEAGRSYHLLPALQVPSSPTDQELQQRPAGRMPALPEAGNSYYILPDVDLGDLSTQQDGEQQQLDSPKMAAESKLRLPEEAMSFHFLPHLEPEEEREEEPEQGTETENVDVEPAAGDRALGGPEEPVEGQEQQEPVEGQEPVEEQDEQDGPVPSEDAEARNQQRAPSPELQQPSQWVAMTSLAQRPKRPQTLLPEAGKSYYLIPEAPAELGLRVATGPSDAGSASIDFAVEPLGSVHNFAGVSREENWAYTCPLHERRPENGDGSSAGFAAGFDRPAVLSGSREPPSQSGPLSALQQARQQVEEAAAAGSLGTDLRDATRSLREQLVLLRQRHTG